MIPQSIAVICILALHSSLASAGGIDIPLLGGASEPFDQPLFGARYRDVNNYLLKKATSDEPADVIDAAKEYNYDLGELRKNRIYTEKEASVKDSLERFITLDEVVEDLANKQCTRRSQYLLGKNALFTDGKVFKSNLGEDRYAGTVRKLILQRAELCGPQYPKLVGYQNVLEYFNVSRWQSQGDLYIKFVDKLVSHLKEKKKFEPYVIPKGLVNEKLGEAVYYAIIEMAKAAGDSRGERLEALTIKKDELPNMLEIYIFEGDKIMRWIGEALFSMAALDKKVVGRNVQLPWENDDVFVSRFEAFLFTIYLNDNKRLVWEQFKEFLKVHKGGIYAHNFPKKQ